jgi:AAA family ATP:ADP antiporter
MPRSTIEKLLAPLGEVRKGEGLLAFLLFLDVFLILSGYYLLKTVREGLILGGGMFGLDGDELKIYASAAIALLLIGIVPAYGRLASRVGRLRLIDLTYGAVIGCLAIFFALGRAGVPVGLAFFLWLGIVNVFLIAQFWSYANDLYTEEQGKRLFAIIALGASTGAIVGPRLATLADTYPMLLAAAAMLGVCVLLYHLVERRARRVPRQAAIAERPLDAAGGFRLLLRDRYLLLIAAMLIVANLVNTTGEYLLSNAVRERFADLPEEARREAIKGFYADFFSWVNLASFVCQALLVSRVIRHLGVRGALFVLPAIALAGYGLIGVIGGLAVIRAVKLAENATDYSLQNTVRHALFLSTSREAKYKAKAAIDTFCVRLGDTAAALLVAASIHVARWSRPELALVCVGLAVGWLAIAAGIAGRRRAGAAEAPAAA